MIEMDKSEYYHSPLEEDALRILLSFLPREVYDQLLYAGDQYVRLNHQPSRNAMEIRSNTDSIGHGAICGDADQKIQEENETVSSPPFR